MRPELLSQTANDFSLVTGGPLYQLLLRIGLVRPPLDRIGWRVAVIVSLAWAPLFLLTALDGRLTGGVKVPFLFDYEVHARLLVGLSLLISAEVTINKRIRVLVRQFVERRIISPRVLPRFEERLESALRLRNSKAIELVLLGLVLAAGNFWSRGYLDVQSSTWYASAASGGKTYEPAGYWYIFFSMPLVQFIALRWYFRLLIWARLLWQVSRLDLNLVPSHPDSCCGLGFLGGIAFALGPFLMAHSVLLSGFIANRILYEGARLPDYKIEILVVAVFLYLIALGPICVFAPRLMKQRQHGLNAYGALASEYVTEFEEKWLQERRPAGEPLIGSGDIQSLADLANSFSVVQHIRPFPFGREALIGLAVFIALPVLPLMLTMFSFQELVARLLQVLL